MLKALQRLLRERDLAFDGYETTVDELKAFCGMGPDESLYFGPEAEMDAEAAAAEDDQEGDSATTLPGQPASSLERFQDFTERDTILDNVVGQGQGHGGSQGKGQGSAPEIDGERAYAPQRAGCDQGLDGARDEHGF